MTRLDITRSSLLVLMLLYYITLYHTMLTCPQNPSIDLQAMARVWRQGQRLPVTVFRFVSEGKIEQSIMKVSDQMDQQQNVRQIEQLMDWWADGSTDAWRFFLLQILD